MRKSIDMIDRERYARQAELLGTDGQDTLAASHVLVIGAGGLGSPLLYYLTAAGIGRITIADGDTVSESNLNRQILYREEDLGRSKAEAAAERLHALNSGCEITPVSMRLEESNATRLITDCACVALAVDNREARLLINRVCCQRGIPLVDGGVDGWCGYVTMAIPGQSACLECWFGERRPAARTPQTTGATAGIVGSMEAMSVIRCLLGHRELAGKMLYFDGARWKTDTLSCDRRPECPACGKIEKY